jgi:hypothetical protein
LFQYYLVRRHIEANKSYDPPPTARSMAAKLAASYSKG